MQSQNDQAEESLRALHDLRDIRGIMERSSRFISLSGWSGVWAGCTALAAAAIGHRLLNAGFEYNAPAAAGWRSLFEDPLLFRLLLLAAATFIVALAGGFYFTARKARQQGTRLWGHSSAQLLIQVAIPMLTGGVFILAFLAYDVVLLIAPACLAFYGLALVNGSKFTLGEIRWLGYCEIVLGCICLIYPGHGLYFMAAGFGLLHILYGLIMWNRYDKGRV